MRATLTVFSALLSIYASSANGTDLSALMDDALANNSTLKSERLLQLAENVEDP
jgi:hypothetical protein